jgi:hypothetical protein
MGPEMNLSKEKKWQKDLAERCHAVFLARGLLGCACPDEIFDYYQVRQQSITSLPVVEMIMGDRLLVWIIDGDKVGEPGQTLAYLLRAGLAERERCGLNRFRLVVVGDFLLWRERWTHLADAMDPKVHLHVLPEIIAGSV